MSSFARILQPLPAARRGYSSFFSSKPGGGRYFNSSKPAQKTVVTTNAASKKPTRDASSGPASDAADKLKQQSADSAPGTRRFLAIASRSASPSAATGSPPTPTPTGPSSSDFASLQPPPNPHPMMDIRDFRLHQFFSIHRPLLLLSDPAAILRNAPPGTTLLGEQTIKQDVHAEWPGSAAEALDAMDADTETARQLNRALTMAQAGNAAAWNDTLRRLGLDVDLEAFEKNQVHLDSVKRKRKKKMKKHKLKKRRRLSRAERQRERSTG